MDRFEEIYKKVNSFSEMLNIAREDSLNKINVLIDKKTSLINSSQSKQYIDIQTKKINDNIREISESFNNKVDTLVEQFNKWIDTQVEYIKQDIVVGMFAKYGVNMNKSAAKEMANKIVPTPDIKIPSISKIEI